MIYYDKEPVISSVHFDFKDAATHGGRSVLQYRALEFRDTPVRPFSGDFTAVPGALYGLVLAGPHPQTARTIVWLPNSPGGPQIWLDSDGDGRLTMDQRYVMTGREIEIPVTITIKLQPEIKQVRRTLIFRRSALGEGLNYAVRGYAAGKLDLGGEMYDALLIDGNADGMFNAPGQDRVWIDLDRDGCFDPLTEQFPLGKPIVNDGQTWVISSDPLASAVHARLRSGTEGNLRLQLPAGQNRRSAKVLAELINDLGELLVVDNFDRFQPVLAGEYYILTLKLELADSADQTWIYIFRSGDKHCFPVLAGQDNIITIMGKLALEVNKGKRANTNRMKPYP